MCSNGVFSPSFLQDADLRDACAQGILNEVLKYKLIFIETPDAVETSAALENYRRVSRVSTVPQDREATTDSPAPRRPATTDEEPSCFLSREGRCLKASISITITAAP